MSSESDSQGQDSLSLKEEKTYGRDSRAKNANKKFMRIDNNDKKTTDSDFSQQIDYQQGDLILCDWEGFGAY